MKAPRTLGVWLSDTLVGYLTHYPDERTVFSVSEEYLDAGPARPILSLAWTHPDDEAQTRRLLLDPRHKSASIKAPPFFSNLLPEGGMRARIAQQLKVHEDREFLLLEALGHDLPGAVILRPVDAPPPGHRHHATQAGTPPINADTADDGVPQTADPTHLKFSLGGMQLKFSMLQQGERYTLNTGGQLGNYIIKPPSHDFPGLPQVEAAAMATARAVGIDVPETLLLHPDQLDGLSNILGDLPDKPFYAIRRFDRNGTSRPSNNSTAPLALKERIHVEDFAQVFSLRTSQKYNRINYDMMAMTLLQYAGGIDDLKEMTRRLVLNVLLGNGDAHIKNWSLIYRTPNKPRLAPAYDLMSTVAWTQHDQTIALNMAGTKRFDAIELDTFNAFFQRLELPGQVREELLAEVRTTTRRVLDVWGEHYEGNGVPAGLMQRIEAHIQGCPLRLAAA